MLGDSTKHKPSVPPNWWSWQENRPFGAVCEDGFGTGTPCKSSGGIAESHGLDGRLFIAAWKW